MLVFSYGIRKSGSTLAFELAKAVARLGGHSQRRRRDLLPGEHSVNFAGKLEATALRRLAEAVGNRVLVVKTHADPGPDWITAYEDLARQGLARAHVNHRDPRDICLSLLDAGLQARSRGETTFSQIVTLADAEASVRRQLGRLAVWSRLPATLPLRYESCAFDTDRAIDAIKADLGVRCPNWPVRLWVRHVAFTQRNKAVPARHLRELDPAEAARLTDQFAPYLEAMGYAGRSAIRM